MQIVSSSLIAWLGRRRGQQARRQEKGAIQKGGLKKNNNNKINKHRTTGRSVIYRGNTRNTTMTTAQRPQQQYQKEKNKTHRAEYTYIKREDSLKRGGAVTHIHRYIYAHIESNDKCKGVF
jgi:hypothetical protein